VRHSRWPAVALAAAVLATGVALAVVAARGPAPPATMDDRVRQVASTLSCPSCVDLSVADSPSLTARSMRAQIGRLLAKGWSADRIRDRFVASFGATILSTPGLHGIDLLAWIAPALLIAFGLGLLVFAVRRWSRGSPSRETGTSTVTASERALLERELASPDLEAP